MLSIPAEFAYGALGAALLGVWIVLYAVNPDGRRAQMRMSLLFLIFIPFELLYLTDYWRPPKHLTVALLGGYLGIEDVLFAFTFGGVVAAVVAFLDAPYRPAGCAATLAAAAGTLALTVAAWRAGINSLVAASVAAALVAAVFVWRRPALVRRLAIGAMAPAVLMFATYLAGFVLSSNTEAVLQSIWLIYGTPLGARFLGVPVTELTWAASFGALIAVLPPVRTLP